MSDSVLLLRRVRERSGEAAAAAAAAVAGTGVGGAPPGGPSPAPGPTPRRKRGRRRRFYPEHRVYRARSSFLDLSEEQVLRRYRLDKAAIAGLCRELGADLESLTGRSHALPVAVKVVCDAAGAITNVVAKFPGSCPNAAVLENSALARLLEGARPEGAWLLGDRSYPLKTWLMTPILFPCGAAEERYNALHHQALAALRQTRALLKRRFRCLDAAGGCLQYAPQKVCQIFLACCVLHNIALRRRMPLEPPEGPDPDPEPELPLQAPHVQISSEARAVRARIVQQVKDSMG
ncbi:putative nuclease HARBI1 isoform X2 [Anas acuta]|uniref:putative nuclease HARBI1 isoform X2 n=1 Tax=Anas acuta TaxID=28680 RepID=UPI0035C87F76